VVTDGHWASVGPVFVRCTMADWVILPIAVLRAII
jgi:hypothetical protein